MITRIPARLQKRTAQARFSVFQLRRGPERRALVRMLSCRTCDGSGGYALTLGDRRLWILCVDCSGGMSAEALRSIVAP